MTNNLSNIRPLPILLLLCYCITNIRVKNSE